MCRVLPFVSGIGVPFGSRNRKGRGVSAEIEEGRVGTPFCGLPICQRCRDLVVKEVNGFTQVVLPSRDSGGYLLVEILFHPNLFVVRWDEGQNL